MSFAEALGKTQLFSGLSETELARIAARGEERVFQKGDVILSEGETSRELFIVGQGTVHVSVKSADASTPLAHLGVPLTHLGVPLTHPGVPLTHLGAGQVIGEMTLVDRGARSATVRAADGPTVLQVIPHAALRELCEQDNHIGFVVMRNLAAELSLRLRYYNITRAMDAE
jgi:CRP-like cAMP-binding protein